MFQIANIFSEKPKRIDQLNNFRIIWLKIGTFTIFSHFIGKFLPHSLQLLLLWPFFCSKYVEILNNIWIITFYIRILAIFGNFWSTFCIIHFSCWFCDHFFAWNNWIHNPGQNIWNKIEKPSKIGQDKKSLISTFACFLTATPKV